MSFKPTRIKVRRNTHLACGKSFYEIDGEELGKCPHCRKQMVSGADVQETSAKTVKFDSMTGNFGY